MAAGCVVCGPTETTLLRCERCFSRVYCGPLCQKKDWQTHKAKCKRPNYIERVDLFPWHIKNPQITRTLSCPAGATFATFHKVLQIAFGWKNISTYDFDVFDDASRCPAIPTSGDDNVGYDLKHGDPIYKLIELKAVGDSDVGPPTLDSSRYSLFEVLDNPYAMGKILCYNYNHIAGGWKHESICLGRADPTGRFVCIDGEGHSCTEDVGGYEGWNQLREAYGEQSPTWYQRTIMAWFETNALNKDPGGLGGKAKWKWDKEMINRGSINLRL